MKRTHLATVESLGEHGMRCPYCNREFQAGDEYVEELQGMVEDAPLVLSGICPTCSADAEKNGLIGCEVCLGTGEWGNPLGQCPWCWGAGEVLASRSSQETDA